MASISPPQPRPDPRPTRCVVPPCGDVNRQIACDDLHRVLGRVDHSLATLWRVRGRLVDQIRRRHAAAGWPEVPTAVLLDTAQAYRHLLGSDGHSLCGLATAQWLRQSTTWTYRAEQRP